MGFVQGVNRNQVVMFPESLDEYIGTDNSVRFIDAFIDSLDLETLGFLRVVPEVRGRPPYNPGDLLKLYLYGYLNRIRSSRMLERESGRNLEVMWLLGKLTPDFKTIADFRKDNGKAIQGVFREFTKICRTMNLFGGQLLVVDGSKFKAVNSRDRNFTQGKLKRLQERADRKLEEYLEALNKADEEEEDNERPTAEELREKIQWLRDRKGDYDEIEKQMEDSGEKQVSLTDSDARSMKLGFSRGTQVGYNVQISVDAKHKLIVDHEVINEGIDTNQLSTMAIRAKEVLGVETLEVLADKGYYNSEEIKDCLDAGVVPYISRPNISKGRGVYDKEQFRFDAENDCYHCPAHKRLEFSWRTTRLGKKVRIYMGTACMECTLKVKCTTGMGPRRIRRWEHENVLVETSRRVKAEPEKMSLRKCIVEHPFGTIKRSMDQGYFLTKGLASVRTETALTMLAYNIKRVLKEFGTQSLIEAMQT